MKFNYINRKTPKQKKPIPYSAGAWPKIDGEKHDGIYCSNQTDALQMHLGLNEHWTAHKIATEHLGYKLNSVQAAHGYAIQKIWREASLDAIVVPIISDGLYDTNYREVYLKNKNGDPLDVHKIYKWLNDEGSL